MEDYKVEGDEVLYIYYCFFKVLSPRADVGVYSGGKNRKKKREERERRDSENNNNVEYKMDEHRDPAAIVRSKLNF